MYETISLEIFPANEPMSYSYSAQVSEIGIVPKFHHKKMSLLGVSYSLE